MLSINYSTKLQYHFLAHIVRDLFEHRQNTILYCYNEDLRLTLLDPQHSIGALMLHTERHVDSESFHCRFWDIGLNNPFVEYNTIDLIISLDYDPQVFNDDTISAAAQIKKLLKKGGKIFLINPGQWAKNLSQFLNFDSYTTGEAKRYSILSSEEVIVYENI